MLIINALTTDWAPPAYLFYNLLFILTLMWTIHSRDSIDAALMVSIPYMLMSEWDADNSNPWWFTQAAVVDLISVIFDFIIIIGYFNKYSKYRVFKSHYKVFNLITSLLFKRVGPDRLQSSTSWCDLSRWLCSTGSSMIEAAWWWVAVFSRQINKGPTRTLIGRIRVCPRNNNVK